MGRSLRQQNWALLAVTVAFYVTGIPIGYYLGLVEGVGLLGIWMGNVIALTVAALLMAVKMLTIDLEALTAKSMLDIPFLKAEADIDTTICNVLASTPTSLSLAGVTRGASLRLDETP